MQSQYFNDLFIGTPFYNDVNIMPIFLDLLDWPKNMHPDVWSSMNTERYNEFIMSNTMIKKRLEIINKYLHIFKDELFNPPTFKLINITNYDFIPTDGEIGGLLFDHKTIIKNLRTFLESEKDSDIFSNVTYILSSYETPYVTSNSTVLPFTEKDGKLVPRRGFSNSVDIHIISSIKNKRNAQERQIYKLKISPKGKIIVPNALTITLIDVYEAIYTFIRLYYYTFGIKVSLQTLTSSTINTLAEVKIPDKMIINRIKLYKLLVNPDTYIDKPYEKPFEVKFITKNNTISVKFDTKCTYTAKKKPKYISMMIYNRQIRVSGSVIKELTDHYLLWADRLFTDLFHTYEDLLIDMSLY